MLENKGKNMKEKLITLASALMLVGGTLITTAQPVPCPDCPPCTNCPPYTNTFTPVEYPTNALLVREAQITINGVLAYVGPTWVLDTNNLLIASGGSWLTNQDSGTWTYTLAITNTLADGVYSLMYASDPGGAFSAVGSPFYGSMDGSELLFNVTGTYGSNGFWAVKQMPGFVALGLPAKKAQGMGQFFGCPGAYVGFIDFTNYPYTRRFYEVDTNVTTHSVTDLYRTTNHIQLFYPNGVDCAVGTASVSVAGDYTAWPSVYFFNNYPTTNNLYRLWFQGFLKPAP